MPAVLDVSEQSQHSIVLPPNLTPQSGFAMDSTSSKLHHCHFAMQHHGFATAARSFTLELVEVKNHPLLPRISESSLSHNAQKVSYCNQDDDDDDEDNDEQVQMKQQQQHSAFCEALQLPSQQKQLPQQKKSRDDDDDDEVNTDENNEGDRSFPLTDDKHDRSGVTQPKRQQKKRKTSQIQAQFVRRSTRFSKPPERFSHKK